MIESTTLLSIPQDQTLIEEIFHFKVHDYKHKYVLILKYANSVKLTRNLLDWSPAIKITPITIPINEVIKYIYKTYEVEYINYKQQESNEDQIIEQNTYNSHLNEIIKYVQT